MAPLKPREIQYRGGITENLFKRILLDKIHVTGIPQPLHRRQDGKMALHWLITLECKTRTDDTPIFIRIDHSINDDDWAEYEKARNLTPVQMLYVYLLPYPSLTL